MWLNHVLLSIAWILYCTLHSLLAGNSTKKYFRQMMKTNYRFYRPAYVLFSFLGLVSLLWWLIVLKSPRIFHQVVPVFIVGCIATCGGFTLMVICIWRYFLSLSGLRSLMNETVTNKLIISGINKFLRHPLYLGTFVFIWGLFLLLPYAGLLISDIIITIYTLIGIKLEESKLVEEFGEDYRLYRKKVPMLLPTFRHRYN